MRDDILTVELNKRIERLKKISRNEINENLIRELCQELLSETSNEQIKKECYSILNELEKNIIIESSDDRYKPYFKYDISLIIKNAVCVCDVILAPPFLVFENINYSPFLTVCSEKLLTRAVCEEALYFFNHCKKGKVIFSLSNQNKYTVLSARLEDHNQRIPIIDKKIFAVLQKVAAIHKGTFLIKLSEKTLSLHLTIKNVNTEYFHYRAAKSYLDMLNDGMSDPYIILGSACK